MSHHRPALLTAALLGLGGCAATIEPTGLEQRTAQAIGRTAEQFTITQRSEETGGRINYTVQTRDGATYRCYLYSATGLQRAMSFGQTPHSDAICTAMVGDPGQGAPAKPAASAPPGSPRGAAPEAECNALLRAAGRC